jgi:hypothetical protein
MESLVEYIKNIDFETVDDHEVLNNVYGEIEGNERRLILNTETTYQMERLIKRSSIPQMLRLYGRLEIAQVINKKLGSRVLELIFDRVFEHVYVKGEKIDLETLLPPVEECFGHHVLGENATHVMRKVFQLVSGRRIEKDKVTRYKPEDPQYIQRYKKEMLRLIPKLHREDGFVTFLYYLRCHRSKTLMHEVAKRHFSCESVCAPATSYFFEHLVGMAGKKTLGLVFETVKNRVMDLCRDRYGNYFVGELIRRYPSKADYFYEAIYAAGFAEHSNVVLKLVLSLQETRSYSSIDAIVRAQYLKDERDILQSTFGGEEGNFKQKYAPMLVNFMKAPAEHSYGVNEAFRKHFRSSWLRSKGGLELVAGYYNGTDGVGEKRMFTRRLYRSVPLLARRREGRALLAHLMRHSDTKGREYTKKMMRL